MIVVKNLTKVYKSGGKEVIALDSISFNLPDSGMIFIVGKSGSGKSTLLNMISGLDSFTSGKIVADGNSLSKMTSEDREKYLGSYIGYIFQDYRLIEDFTVRQNVELAADISDSGMYYQRYLRDVGLEGYEDRFPKELSGGQKQRVAIARALIKKPRVILADEPTGNLDKATTKEILRLLKQISKHTLVILVSHNLRDADEYADRIIELSDGKVVKDESRVPGYENKFCYKDGYINLPHHKDLGLEEIGEVLRRSRYSKGIIQNTSGFLPTEEERGRGRKTRLRNKGMSLSNLAKVFSIFFKRKLLSKLTTVFLAAVILSVYYIIQSLTLYDTHTALINTLINTNSYGAIIQTQQNEFSMTEKYIGVIREKKIQELDEAYSGNMYRLYNQFLNTTSKYLGDNTAVSVQNTLNYYCLMTVGTLNTTEEYACKVLGVDELTVLAGDPYDKEYGVVITDYTADSMIYNYKAQNPLSEELTYGDIIGERKVGSENFYINAIVDTGYEDEHREIMDILSSLSGDSNFDQLATDQRYIDFVSDMNERYNVGYNFSENYEEALREYYVESGRCVISGFFIDDNRYSATMTPVFAINEELGLADGEVAMSLNIYNKIYTQNLTADDIDNDSFRPRKLGFARYESGMVKELAVREDFTVTQLVPKNGYIYVNENTYREMLNVNTFTYSVYLDDPELAKETLDVVKENSLTIYSGKVGNVYFIERCINVFENFFTITQVIILLACAVFLVNFGVKSIRSNIYEIGVIKAMGGVRRDISKIFISQSLVMGVGILIVTYFGMQLGAYVANDVFLTTLAAVAGADFYGIRAIDFYPEVALYDIGIALSVVVISAIISTRSIDKLNLISILKAKE